MDDGVQESLFEQELGALEAFRKLLPDRLLNYARSRKTDESAGLRDVQVPSMAKLAVTPPVVGSVRTQM